MARDPKLEGALYGLAGASLLAAAAAGLWKLYSYYSVRRAQYTLTYFNGRGLAETSRYMFALAGVAYEDQRLQGDSKSQQFQQTKDELPFGQVPVLQLHGPAGPLIAQSKAIERFLARRFGFMGGDEVEAAVVDSIGEALVDARNAFNKARDDPAEKARFLSTALPAALRFINRVANERSSSAERNTLVGSALSLADLQLFHFLSIHDDQAAVSRAVDPFPIVKASRANVAAQPQIQDWISKRPNTPF